MAFIDNPTNDPVLRCGERLGRFGSMVPPLSLASVNLAGAIAFAAIGRHIPWNLVVGIILGATVVGQLMVWIGLVFLRRSAGWDCGILFYLWAGGVVAALTILFTGVFSLLPVPWIAPVVATIAKMRLSRRKRTQQGAAT